MSYSQLKHIVDVLRSKGCRIRLHQPMYEVTAHSSGETYIVDQKISLTKAELKSLMPNLSYGSQKHLNEVGEILDAPFLALDYWVSFEFKPNLFDDGPDSLAGGKICDLKDL